MEPNMQTVCSPGITKNIHVLTQYVCLWHIRVKDFKIILDGLARLTSTLALSIWPFMLPVHNFSKPHSRFLFKFFISTPTLGDIHQHVRQTYPAVSLWIGLKMSVLQEVHGTS